MEGVSVVEVGAYNHLLTSQNGLSFDCRASAYSVSRKNRPKYKGTMHDVIVQGKACKAAIENGIKQAAAGQRVAGDVVYLLEQLQKKPPQDEVIDLLQDLQNNVLDLLRETKAVSDKLREVRLGLHIVSHLSH